ncbi:MAG: hypothetical protein M3421_14480 [Bacteroidota bacterium]|nr:hypothetical protein [Bacteroidota bacterium]
MQNPTTTATVWVKGWDGVRNTTFVKANSFDYTNASVEAAAAAFAGGTVLSSVNNVAIGDIYIARIKGQSNYPVIKVTYADGDIASSNAE